MTIQFIQQNTSKRSGPLPLLVGAHSAQMRRLPVQVIVNDESTLPAWLHTFLFCMRDRCCTDCLRKVTQSAPEFQSRRYL